MEPFEGFRLIQRPADNGNGHLVFCIPKNSKIQHNKKRFSFEGADWKIIWRNDKANPDYIAFGAVKIEVITKELAKPDKRRKIKDFHKEFSERLRSSADRHDLSQLELARRLEVSRTMVGNWFGGRNLPSIETLAKLVELLPNTRLDWLLTGKNS